MTKYAARGLTISLDGTPLGQVTSMGMAGSSRDLIDASAYGDDWKDYVLGQQDGDEVAVVLALDPTDNGHGALLTAYNTASEVVVTMAHSDSTFDIDFTAIVTALSRGGDLGGLLAMNATFKIIEPGVVEGS